MDPNSRSFPRWPFSRAAFRQARRGLSERGRRRVLLLDFELSRLARDGFVRESLLYLPYVPIFVFGLGLFLQSFEGLFRSVRWTFVSTAALLLGFVLWNAGLIFQWGAHLIPARGPVSFSEITHNQVFVVPRQLSADLRRYIFKRKGLMQQIEQRDIQELERNPPPP